MTNTSTHVTLALPLTTLSDAQRAELNNPTGHFWWWGATPEQVTRWITETAEWEPLPTVNDGPLENLSFRRLGTEPIVAEFLFDKAGLFGRRYVVPVAEAPTIHGAFEAYTGLFLSDENPDDIQDAERFSDTEIDFKDHVGTAGAYCYFVGAWAPASGQE